MKSWIIGATAITLLLVAACGGDDDVEPATETPEAAEPTATESVEATATVELGTTFEEREYLTAVAELIADFSAVAEAQDEAIRELWPTRERFFAEFENYNATAAIVASGEAARALEPPERFAEAHEDLLAWFDSMERWVPIRDEALADQDLLAFLANNGEIRADFLNLLVHTDPVFCSHIAFPGTARFCAETNTQFGAYETAVRLASDEFFAQAGPRFGFPAAMTDEETATLLLLRQPAIILAFEATIASIESLTPSEKFADDHQRYIQYWTELLGISREITAAAEAGEIIYFRDELAPKSGEPGCSASGDISSEYQSLVNANLGCPGAQ